jgi:hypothetical protein
MKIAFCIRGHIRDGLIDSGLNNFLTQLKNNGHTIDLFLHTWSESEAKTSYKNLDTRYIYSVSNELVGFYFKDHEIKYISIDDDSQIELIGNTIGNVCLSSCPLIAWKRMWYGKWKLIKHIYDNYHDDYDIVVSTRYDMFTNKLCITSPQRLNRMLLGKDLINFRYPKFNTNIVGVDNFYCGILNNMAKLTYDFTHNLDEIMNRYHETRFQEEMVYRYAIDNNLTSIKYEDSILYTGSYTHGI